MICPGQEGTKREAVTSHLNAGRIHARWRGLSSCRLCGVHNGSTCLTDGTYVWPSGFSHYIREHNVRPPDDFIQHVLQKRRQQ
jgi:hypothetical protein